MPIDLADFIDGTPGRFVPAEMRGQLVETEHLARYLWTSQLGEGRRVLDAGCGLGYGAALLARSGAAEVVGIDIAEEVVEAIGAAAPDGVRFAVADVRELPFEEASFDLIVCFEVIEHIDGQEQALDELKRVLAPGGLLAISSPNPDIYVEGNPHHVHELRPDELSQLLGARFPAVALFQQHDFTASCVLTDASAALDDGGAITASVHKLQARSGGEAPYTIALAGDAMPTATELVTLGSTVDVGKWLKLFDEQQQILQDQAAALSEIERMQQDRRELLRLLAESETALAAHEAAAAQAEETQLELTEQLHAVHVRAARAEGVARTLQTSLSWRVTRPLRLAKRLMRPFRR
jgi:SAM-dependent methyltransferase